jgi:hypothetical protein
VGWSVVDLASGRTRTHESPVRLPATWGIAWADASHARVAWDELPPGADRIYRPGEVVKTVTLTAQ